MVSVNANWPEGVYWIYAYIMCIMFMLGVCVCTCYLFQCRHTVWVCTVYVCVVRISEVCISMYVYVYTSMFFYILLLLLPTLPHNEIPVK